MTDPVADPHIQALFAQRPIIIAIAGPNGAGKSTFYDAFLSTAGLRFVNADVLAAKLSKDAYEAAAMADVLRRQLVKLRESFVFETVFSDPKGEKLAFLTEAAASGYTVVLCFIGISSSTRSDERVAMRVSQGGHDIPTDKLIQRYPRTLRNLNAALKQLPNILVYDNDDLRDPYRLVSIHAQGKAIWRSETAPSWAAGKRRRK